MRFLAACLLATVLSGCGYTQVNYDAAPMQSRAQAVSVVEQVFLEDHVTKQRPDHVSVGPEYIVLADGVVTRGTSYGSAMPIGGGAIGLGTSTSVMREAGARIYYNSIGAVTLHKKRWRENRYSILIRNHEGAVLRRISTTNFGNAKRFVDAMYYLKSQSSSTN